MTQLALFETIEILFDTEEAALTYLDSFLASSRYECLGHRLRYDQKRSHWVLEVDYVEK